MKRKATKRQRNKVKKVVSQRPKKKPAAKKPKAQAPPFSWGKLGKGIVIGILYLVIVVFVILPFSLIGRRNG